MSDMQRQIQEAVDAALWDRISDKAAFVEHYVQTVEQSNILALLDTEDLVRELAQRDANARPLSEIPAQELLAEVRDRGWSAMAYALADYLGQMPAIDLRKALANVSMRDVLWDQILGKLSLFPTQELLNEVRDRGWTAMANELAYYLGDMSASDLRKALANVSMHDVLWDQIPNKFSLVEDYIRNVDPSGVAELLDTSTLMRELGGRHIATGPKQFTTAEMLQELLDRSQSKETK